MEKRVLSPTGGVRAARRVSQRVGRARDLRSRRPPRLEMSKRRGRSPTIYYLCPDDNAPTGGIRGIYRHVDVLNRADLPAAVIHRQRGFRCSWFANSTRVVYARDVTLSPTDLLIVPEYNAPMMHVLPPTARKVVFNQNVYRALDYGPSMGADTPGVEAVLTVSRDNAALLAYAFPKLVVHVARNVIDGGLFHPRPVQAPPPARHISYMPRRRVAEQRQVLHLLGGRDSLAGWDYVPIDGQSEAGTAAIMRECPIFLSFSEREGFGLPPAEAMASGAYVVGFTGLAGRDYFDPAYCAPIAEGDLLGFAQAVETIVTRFDADPESVLHDARAASDHIRTTYTMAGLREDLLSFYGSLL